MLVNLTQKDIEHIILEVLRYLKEENNVPLELISGEMIDRGLVTEGLITSYSATSFRNLLKKLIPISKYPEISFHINRNREGSEQIYLTVGDVEQEVVDRIVHYLGVYGWYISMVKFDRGYEKYDKQKLVNNFTIIAEPKYDVEVEDVPEFLYHISPAKVEKKIGSKGLNPRSYGKVGNHPERIYLFTEMPDNWVEIAEEWKMRYGDEDMVYNLYQISTKNLKIPFFKDQNSNFIRAVYTTEPIPYYSIKKIGEN